MAAICSTGTNNVLRVEKTKHIKRRSSAEQRTLNTIEHIRSVEKQVYSDGRKRWRLIKSTFDIQNQHIY